MIYADYGHGIVILFFDDEEISKSFQSFLLDYISSKDIIRQNCIISIPNYIYLKYKNEIENFCFCFNQPISKKESVLLLEENVKEPTSQKNEITEESIQGILNGMGFKRTLTAFQKRNLVKILPLKSAALFSVPGAGKTSEALAYYLYHRRKGDRLLVISPKNAFSSWSEQLAFCLGENETAFCRLEQNYFKQSSPLLLPEKMIISYQQLILCKDMLQFELDPKHSFIFVDESHRMKNPKSKCTEALLNLFCDGNRKLILSGTPMPQSSEDLLSQFRFLFPGRSVDCKSVIKSFQPYFTRTTSNELQIPKIEKHIVSIEMEKEQQKLYQLCVSFINRQLADLLSVFDKKAFSTINHYVILILEFLSMPESVSHYFKQPFDSDLVRMFNNMKGSKYNAAINLTEKLMEDPKRKIIIWSSFVKSILSLEKDLNKYGAQAIYGNTESGSKYDGNTREGKIEAFRNDPTKRVLIMNPLSCGESISLQMCCSTAIYLDRTFHAASYLQSLDRIHRIGIKKSPQVYILQAKGTLDELVEAKLQLKIERMYRALNDENLQISQFSYNDEDANSKTLDRDDMTSIVKYLRNNK